MPYKFNFNPPVAAPLYRGFYASVVLPTNPGDTVAIIGAANEPAVNTSWERWSNDEWHTMRWAWGDNQNYRLAILPIVECQPVGIKKNSLLENGVDLFPNPSDGHFTLVTTFMSAQDVGLRIYNVLGQTVYTNTLHQATREVQEINMSEQSPGVYFVELNNGSEKVVKRMIVAR